MYDPHSESGKRFRRRRLASILAMVCAAFHSGCQLLTVTEVDTPQAPAKAEPSDLQRLLAAGSWQIDPQWSILKWTSNPDGGAAALESWRWRFVIPEPPKVLPTGAEKPPELPADIAELKSRYAWLWDAAIPPEKDTAESQSDHWKELETVARQTGPTGLTATILLARLSPGHPEQWDLLFESMPPKPDASIKPETYAAAAETLCRVSATPIGDPEENFAVAGRWLEAAPLSEPVRAELLRGIARRIAPRQIPGLVEIVSQKDAALLAGPIYRAAIESCVTYAWNQKSEQDSGQFNEELWPEGLWSCRFSKDPALRQLFGRWSALAGHPESLAVLKSQRLDVDLNVREEAVVSLGLLSGDAAQDELRSALTHGTDPERDAAIAALARGGVEAILPYARHDSPRLRATVARELNHFPTRTAAVALASLMSDRSAKVQLAAVESCIQPGWENTGRATLLLHALRVGTLETQMAALEHLRTEWGHEPTFPLNGTDTERETAVRKLAAEHQVSVEVFTKFVAIAESQSTSDQTRSSLNEDEIRQRLRAYLDSSTSATGLSGDGEMLAGLDASAVPVIEQELNGLTASKAEAIYHDVLPKLQPLYASLVLLESKDVVRRRRAAREIHDAASSASLSPQFLRRLEQRMVAEQDRQVWQDVTFALLPDALPEAAQVALIALNSPWPDIRQFGCEYFERHPQPEYADWLLPLLEEPDRQLKLRAIRILAACGNPQVLGNAQDSAGTPGLRKLLTESDTQLRWEVVRAMTALGDQQAAQEIIRQSYDPHPRQRELAVIAMGESSQTRFMEHLLRRAWTENDVAVQAAMLKALDQLAPMDHRPGLAPSLSIGDKITEWARWWDEEQKRLPAHLPDTTSARMKAR